MKINSINPQINFGKVIEIQYDRNRECSRFQDEEYIVSVLNNQRSELYTKAEAKQIKDFFNPLFGKDNKNIIFRKYGDKKYFVSGQEANEILKIEKFAKDMHKIELPSTSYTIYCGPNADGVINNKIKAIAGDIWKNAKEKGGQITNCSFREDKSPIKVTMTENKTSEGTFQKIYHFEATQKNAGEIEKTSTLNLSI